jgi:hypothetical protein
MHVTSLDVNDALQMVPQGEAGRSENELSWRPHNWSVLTYALTWVATI